ncbi:carbohydrate kinase [Ferrimonas sediminicola]|uniref:Carbohydrate kinase n=1 Tax=Ferrimonas sediminicola TaxID=2569538 RepID=A0A4U1B9S6_9GAMM|nr:FGGY-family carbohydrate kinase [Ferrimonas sediminicola]TKB47306.1 carbohydrate kinase [Ferrimonas sediminicola]
MTDAILAIDNGTQSLRALLFDAEGTLLDKSQVHFSPPYHSPQPGAAEMDAEIYWQALVDAVKRLGDQGNTLTRVKAVTVTAQRTSLVFLDRHGVPLRPAVLWTDQRQCRDLPPLPWYLRPLGWLPYIGHSFNTLRRRAFSNMLASYEPRLWQRCAKVVQVGGYLSYRLTGLYRDSTAGQVGYLPFDYKRQRWAPQGNWRWHALSLTPSQMPQLVAPGELLGHLADEVAERLGLPAQLPVVAAGGDKACEILGSGGHQEGVASLSFGTTATVNVVSSRYREIVPLMPAYPAAVAGEYLCEVMLFRGFWMVSWFKEQFGQLEQLLAEEQNTVAEKLLDQLINAAEPGSEGLILQPYWGAGVRQPGPEARGAIIGFGDHHTRAHLYRAIIEGLCYGLKEGLDRVEKRCGSHTRLLRVSGGGAQSDAILQLTADLFGLPVERAHTTETSGLGAALCAALHLGWYPDVAQATRGMIRVGKRFEPNPLHHQRYRTLYREVYLKLYGRLHPLYHRLARLNRNQG